MNYSDIGAGLCQMTAGGFFYVKRFQCSGNLQHKLELNLLCKGMRTSVVMKCTFLKFVTAFTVFEAVKSMMEESGLSNDSCYGIYNYSKCLWLFANSFNTYAPALYRKLPLSHPQLLRNPHEKKTPLR